MLQVHSLLNLTGEDNREGIYAQVANYLDYYSKDNQKQSVEDLLKRLDQEYKDTPGSLELYKYYYNIKDKVKQKYNIKPYVIAVNPKTGNIFNISKELVLPVNYKGKPEGVLDAIKSGYYGEFDPRIVNKFKQLVELEWKKINEISKFVISKSKKLDPNE